MHSAIFVATESDDPSNNFLGFIEDANKNAQIAKGSERLGRNVWLVHFRKSPAALAYLVASAATRSIAYRILPLDGEPQWLPDDSNAGRIP